MDAVPQLGAAADRTRWPVAPVAVATALVALTILASFFAGTPLPHLTAFIPICATLWLVSDLLTAFLLMTQFYVAGTVAFATIAIAYEFAGLLTVPYLMSFPGVLTNGPPSIADAQVSAMLYSVWHTSFPLIIAITYLVDPTFERIAGRRSSIRPSLLASIGGTFALAVTIALAARGFRTHLPVVISPDGQFTALWATHFMPVVVGVNVIATAIVIARIKNLSLLNMWIAVALVALALDGVLNAGSPARYTLAWYVGKFETLGASVTVLGALLCDIATLYRRLFVFAGIDALTGLQNRRALDVHLATAAKPRRPTGDGDAVLMLDIDFFKRFNDRFGHAAGDDALRAVGEALKRSIMRNSDTIARYGGEEFVVHLPDTSLEGAIAVAERIRSCVAACVPLPQLPVERLTVSIGVAYARREAREDRESLLARADRALYTAKETGRNRVAVDGIGPRSLDGPSRTYAAVASGTRSSVA